MAARRSLCLAVGVALCAFPGPLRTAANGLPTAAALLAKHRAFVGWRLGDGAFKTLRLTRELANAQGKATQRAIEYRVGLIYRNHYVYPERADTTDDAGFTGSIFWNSNVNGFTTPLYGELARFRLSYALLVNEGTTALEGIAGDNASVQGKPAQIVHLTVPHADPIDVYVDPASGAYLRGVIDPGGDDEATIEILSYTEVLPGKKMIGSFRFGEDSAGTYSYSKIEPNVPISDADLHPPPQRASWAFENPHAFSITVTTKRVLVDATVNGTKGRFILDTGANSVFLNRSFANRANVAKLNVNGTVLGLLGAQPSDMRRADSLQIGGNTLSNVIVNAPDFNFRDYRGLDRQNYDGLLGYDVFAGAIVKVDFQAQTMTIADPSSALGDPGGLSVLTDTSSWIPTIPMRLNRSLAVNAMLDTGDPSSIVFGPELLYKYHLRMARNIGVQAGLGSVECGNLDSLEIGPITYSGEMACKLDSQLVSGRKILVGLDFLRHFTVVFDYPRGRLYLQPYRQ